MLPPPFSLRVWQLLLLVVLAVGPGAFLRAESSPPPPKILRNVVYGHTDGRDLKLDLYLPADRNDTHPKPVLIFLHGGGWRVLSKSEIKPYVSRITAAGYVVAAADYRLSNVGRFPAQIFDSKTAVRWVRANAARYGIDPARIGVLGFSAGGHLGSLLGTSAGVKSLEDESAGSPGVSSRVQAVCNVSGPVDLTQPTRSLIGKLSILGLFGGTAQEKPELARSGNPALYATPDDAPTLMIFGEQDKLVSPIHARILSEALHKVSVEATTVIVRGGGHVPFYEQQQRTALEFFGRHLNRP